MDKDREKEKLKRKVIKYISNNFETARWFLRAKVDLRKERERVNLLQENWGQIDWESVLVKDQTLETGNSESNLIPLTRFPKEIIMETIEITTEEGAILMEEIEEVAKEVAKEVGKEVVADD